MEQLTKEQLLAKAKETYKEGMEVICLHSGTKKTIGKYKPHSFADNNDIWIGSKPSLSIKIYDSLRGGKWAEIISTQRQHDGYIVIYTELDMKQYAMECVANFLSNDKNEIEMKLTEIIIDRNDKQFLKFREKHYPEQTEQTKPDYSKVIELIEEQIEYRKENITDNLNEKNYLVVGYDELRIKELQFIIQGIKAL